VPSMAGHQHAPEGFRIVAQLARITNPHGKAFPALDGGGEGAPADGHGDHILHVRDVQPVAGNGGAVDFDLEIGFAHHPVGVDRGGVDGRHLAHEAFDLHRHAVQRVQIGGPQLDPHGGAHAGLQHDQACFDGLQLRGAGGAGDLGGVTISSQISRGERM
jgi:hypothetical protein